MRKSKDEIRYFNFPIELLKHFLNEPDDTYSGYTYKTCLEAIQKYSVYSKAKTYHDLNPKEKLLKCEEYFGKHITHDYYSYFKDSAELYYNINANGENKVMTGLSIDLFEDYYDNVKKESEKIQLLGYLAMRSIIGDQKYKGHITINYVLSRMDGKPEAVKNITELSRRLINYFGTKNDYGFEIKEYGWKKFIKDLQNNNWNLKYYSKYMRGFYISFELSIDDLVMKAISNKKSVKDKVRKKQIADAERKAMERLGLAS